MCFQEPFKNINDDGNRTAVIQSLWYVTIQEATRLVLGCWHKEADESLDRARKAGFFLGRFSGERDAEVSKDGASPLSRDVHSSPSSPWWDCSPINYVAVVTMILLPETNSRWYLAVCSPWLCPSKF